MVRKCIVDGCQQTDQTILAHRFPIKQILLDSWRECLELDRIVYSDTDLAKKYVVCSQHFKKSDYRNAISSFLNTTAKPAISIPPEDRKTYLYNADSQSEDCAQQTQDQYQEKDNEQVVNNREIEIELIQIEDEESMDDFILTITKEDENDDKIEYLEDDSSALCKESTPNKDPKLKRPIFKKKKDNLGKFIRNLSSVNLISNQINQTDLESPKLSTSPINESFLETHVKDSASQTENLDDRQNIIDAAQQEEDEILDKYNEFSGKSKIDLIKEIIKAKSKLIKLEEKLENFQVSHAKMVQSMEVFKSLTD